MDQQILQILHFCFTALTAIVVGILHFISKKNKSKNKEEAICKEEFQELKTEVAVLKEHIKGIETMANSKLDEILRNL